MYLIHLIHTQKLTQIQVICEIETDSILKDEWRAFRQCHLIQLYHVLPDPSSCLLMRDLLMGRFRYRRATIYCQTGGWKSNPYFLS